MNDRKSNNRPCLQVEVTGEWFYRRLFYNGDLCLNVLWAAEEFFAAISRVATGTNQQQRCVAPAYSTFLICPAR